jgi:AraC-like DNA-binding protein
VASPPLSFPAEFEPRFAGAICTRSREANPGRGATTVGPLPDWRLKRVQTLVEEHFDEALTLPDLAAAAGVSRMHFAAQFRAATGMRPHEYLLARRVQWAMAQMVEGGEPLALLALSAGFQSQSHFTTVFRRMTGTTPGVWRAGNARTSS